MPSIISHMQHRNQVRFCSRMYVMAAMCKGPSQIAYFFVGMRAIQPRLLSLWASQERSCTDGPAFRPGASRERSGLSRKCAAIYGGGYDVSAGPPPHGAETNRPRGYAVAKTGATVVANDPAVADAAASTGRCCRGVNCAPLRSKTRAFTPSRGPTYIAPGLLPLR
jgi:hypothetical protein